MWWKATQSVLLLLRLRVVILLNLFNKEDMLLSDMECTVLPFNEKQNFMSVAKTTWCQWLRCVDMLRTVADMSFYVCASIVAITASRLDLDPLELLVVCFLCRHEPLIGAAVDSFLQATSSWYSQLQ